MQEFFAVVFVLTLLCGAVVVLRKKGIAIANTPLLARKQPALIHQLDKMRLTPHHSILLLRVEDRKLLIAIHPQGVTLLDEGAQQTSCPGFKGVAVGQ